MSHPISQNDAPINSAAPAKKRNVVGLIALFCAIAGLIFSCVKGALILGWILLPFGFILGLVGLFLPNKPRGAALGAVITSVIGTVVAAVVFVFVVGQAVDESFNQDSKVTAPDSGGATDKKAGSDRANPLPIGSRIETKDWAVTVNSVNLNADDIIAQANPFNEAPSDGKKYVLVNLTAEYLGNAPEGRAPFASVAYVTPSGNTINSFDKNIVEPEPFDVTGTLYHGAVATGNMAFEVPAREADQGVLAVSPDTFAQKKFVKLS